MNRDGLKWRVLPVVVLCASLWPHFPWACAESTQELKQADIGETWRSPAKMHHMVGREPGDVTIGGDGIEFKSRNGRSMRWPFLEVQTFRLTPHSLAIETYQNRKRHLPGMQRYRFDLDDAVTPGVAAELARKVQRPSQNAVPDPALKSILIPAHHRTRAGGTNGTLRLRDGGIDYVSSVSRDSRSWRWADIQTLSDPDPYHLLVFGYRDTYTFDLKEPLRESVFDRLTDAVDANHAADPGQRPYVQSPENSHSPGQGVGDE